MKSKSRTVKSGERTNTAGKPISNLILLSLSDSDYRLLRPHLEYVDMPNHLVLHEGGAKLEFAYFPNRGLISLVVAMKDGKTAEAHGRWVSGNGCGLGRHLAIHCAAAIDTEPLRSCSGDAGCSNSGM